MIKYLSRKKKAMDIFKSKNLFVSSFILTAGSGKIQFLGLENLDRKTKLFKFAPAEAAKDLEIKYFSGGKVSAKQLFSEYNNLKDLLFQRETNGDTYGSATE